jgi:hypothetical protein
MTSQSPQVAGIAPGRQIDDENSFEPERGIANIAQSAVMATGL